MSSKEISKDSSKYIKHALLHIYVCVLRIHNIYVCPHKTICVTSYIYTHTHTDALVGLLNTGTVLYTSSKEVVKQVLLHTYVCVLINIIHNICVSP